MRACEGCRRRKIKCDAATTNTWPCSACIRLKLSCVRPNGYDENGATLYEPSTPETMLPMVMPGGFPVFHHPNQQSYLQSVSHPSLSPLSPQSMAGMFSAQQQGLMGSFQVAMYPDTYADPSAGQQQQQNHHHHHQQQQQHHRHQNQHHTPINTTIPQSMALMSPVSTLDQHFAAHATYSVPQLYQPHARPSQGQVQTQLQAPMPMSASIPGRPPLDASSPESTSQDVAPHDLADLLGSLNVNEAGTGRASGVAGAVWGCFEANIKL